MALSLPLFLLLLKLSGRRRRFESEDGLRRAVARDRARVRPDPPAALRRTLDMHERELNGMRCWRLAPRTGATSTRLLYLHGGAHVAEIAPPHWRLAAELVERTGCSAHVPAFPLAPEHDHRLAFDAAATLYRELCAGDLVVIGDSSGGGFALALVQHMLAAGFDAPRDLVLLSPWLDLTLHHAEAASARVDDPWLALPGLRSAARAWAGTDDPAAPHLSPLHGQLVGLRRVHLFAGTREIFIDECRALRDRASAEGVDVRWIEGDGMIHVWPLLPLAAARPVRDRLAAIVRGQG